MSANLTLCSLGLGLLETPASPSLSSPGLTHGPRATRFAYADPTEKVWLEVEPVGMLKEGDRVEIRCLADGNPPPHFSISKQVWGLCAACRWGCKQRPGGEWREGHSAHLPSLPQNPSTREAEEETTNDNGVLVLEPAQKEHSGLYECQGLDLDTMISLPSEPQELLVNCEELGTQDRGSRLG